MLNLDEIESRYSYGDTNRARLAVEFGEVGPGGHGGRSHALMPVSAPGGSPWGHSRMAGMFATA